jgi:hypothetical protein
MNRPSGSYSVMAQTPNPADALALFPTPPWATRALCEWLLAAGYQLAVSDCLEPAAGRGHMSFPLAEYFAQVKCSDVVDFGMGFGVSDFLMSGDAEQHDWIITNPPFALAADFIHEGVKRSRIGVAMFVRTSFLEGTGRYRDLFGVHKPKAVLQFSERVPLVKGRCDARASTATAYCWIVWTRGRAGWPTEFHWIPPCRKRLERVGDYDAESADA